MARYRKVAIAAGHSVTVRRSRVQTSRAGFVRVEKSHRPAFEIPQAVWDAGEDAHG